jgi:hypothetical protein
MTRESHIDPPPYRPRCAAARSRAQRARLADQNRHVFSIFHPCALRIGERFLLCIPRQDDKVNFTVSSRGASLHSGQASPARATPDLQEEKMTRQLSPARGLLAFFAIIGLVAVDAHAQLYGISDPDIGGGVPATLYTINPATGAATTIANLSGAVFSSINGLDALGGTLYASDIAISTNPTQWRFGTVNRTTAAFTPINNQSGSSNWHGLAGNDNAGVLYTVDNDDGQTLKSITPAGAVTTIGPTGVDPPGFAGLAYDANHNVLYGVTFREMGALYSINTATGLATRIGRLDPASSLFATTALGLTYDPIHDVLFLNNADTNRLYSVNTATGLATSIGLNGATNSGIDGLAFIVPEPSCFVLPLAALLHLRRGRKR